MPHIPAPATAVTIRGSSFRFAAVLSSLIAIAALAGACKGSDASPARRTIIDSRDNYDPRSLDPAKSTDVPTGRAVGYLFDGLTRFTPDARVVPALATRWEISADGRTYTFHLRTGVTFHDGTPFVARQVAHSFERALDPKERGGRGWPLYPIQGAKAFADGKAPTISGLTVTDDSTLVVVLDEAFPIFPKLLAMPVAAIVPDSTPASFGEHPVGTGPWRFVEWKHDDYVKFARNDKYWGGPASSDSLMARIIAEPSTAVAEFESGNVDILYIPESDTRRWENTDERSATLASAPGLRLWYMAINTTRGPLKDVRVRQAINYAVDTRTLLDQLIGGRGDVAGGVVPPALDGGDSTRHYAYDTTKARQLLADAGFAKGIDVDLWTGQTPPFPRLAEAIQSYLAKVGIRAKIVQRESAAMREAARKGETDLALKDWFADYPDAENFLYPLLHSANRGVGGNVSFYQNQGFDKLVDAARREADDAKRVELYRQADALAFNDAPMLYLFFYKDLDAVQPWIRGFQLPSILNGQDMRGVSIEHEGSGRQAAGGGGGPRLGRRGDPGAMIRVLLRRLLLSIPTLFGVLVVVFLLLYVAPGDPVMAMVGERADPETIARLRAELRLDDPLPAQFAHYAGGVLRGDLGNSYITGRPILSDLLERFPKTLQLAGAAMLLAAICGITLGVLAARHPGGWVDRLSLGVAYLGISFPVYWIGLILILVFAVQLRWLPPSGFGRPENLVLPALALGMRSIAFLARMTRSAMLEALGADFTRTAKAKGVQERVVVVRHALRNALIPVITVLGLDFGAYLTGSILTETIFSWPGLGRYVVNAIARRDLPGVQGAVLFMSVVFVLVNLVTDLAYAKADPRVRLG